VLDGSEKIKFVRNFLPVRCIITLQAFKHSNLSKFQPLALRNPSITSTSRFIQARFASLRGLFFLRVLPRTIGKISLEISLKKGKIGSIRGRAPESGYIVEDAEMSLKWDVAKPNTSIEFIEEKVPVRNHPRSNVQAVCAPFLPPPSFSYPLAAASLSLSIQLDFKDVKGCISLFFACYYEF